MLSISPVLQDFPRHHLHVLVEGNGVGLERRGDAIGDAESKILERDGHLSSGAGIRLIPQPHDGYAQIEFGLLDESELDAIDRGLRDEYPALGDLIRDRLLGVEPGFDQRENNVRRFVHRQSVMHQCIKRNT